MHVMVIISLYMVMKHYLGGLNTRRIQIIEVFGNFKGTPGTCPLSSYPGETQLGWIYNTWGLKKR
jgi:hypothetical protein